ncbi:hypothetical protein F7725_025743 [Dissostichus mawsoni]|uniref:Translation initiation factor beta propellor-like domain-containing protein n=2 Tax=Nototheniidae TaxID=8206 RepID=A0A7J5X6H9_DISMA|nr:hypothetical protein F7725_025743 [Dissostichus mawsoni]
MAARWSSENVVVEFRDAQATAMSVDCLGSHAVLSGRRFLYMVNLEAPSEQPRKIGRQSKWDVGTVQWKPHRDEAHVFAASSNQRVDLYSWKDGCGEIHSSLQGHTRVISDLDWSWFEPELLVTSSVDTYIYIWDTSTAVEYVAAHLSKIHGLDWHPDNEFVFATSSQDNSVRPRKYLNILSCQVPVWKARYTPFSNGLVTVMVPQLRRENSLLLWSSLDLNSPVHAFVGHDDVVLEFQLEGLPAGDLVQRSDSEDLEGRPSAAEGADGGDVSHRGVGEVSFSQEPDSQYSVGLAADNLTDQDVALISAVGSGVPQTLQQEFSLVNLQIRNVNVEPSGPPGGQVSRSISQQRRAQLPVRPPTTIPSAMKTKIQKILTDTSLQKVKRNQNCLEPCVRQLVSCLESDMDANIPFPRTSGARFCGTGCLVSLSALSAYHSGVLTPMKMRSESQSTLRLYSGSPTRSEKDTVSISSFYYKERKSRRFKTKREGMDYGQRPIKLAGKVIIQEISCLLPVHKALGESYILNMNDIQETCQKNAAASLTVGRRDVAKVTNLHFYISNVYSKLKVKNKTQRYATTCNNTLQHATTHNDTLRHSTTRFNMQQHTTTRYDTLRHATTHNDTLRHATTRFNAQQHTSTHCLGPGVCGHQPGPESGLGPGHGDAVGQTPVWRHLLETLLDHYSHMSDVQTLAMLCSVFRAQPPQTFTLCTDIDPPSSPLTTLDIITSSSVNSGSCSSTSDSVTAGTWSTGRDCEQVNPWAESSPDDHRCGSQGPSDPREREREQHDMNKRLLDPTNTLQFDDFKKCYGEILHRWGLREKRADVLKFASCPPEPHKGIEFGVYCCHCRSQARGTQCAVCKRLTFQCAICHVAVRGSSNFCLSCGHGGHTSGRTSVRPAAAATACCRAPSDCTGTETNTPPASERNLLTAQGRPGTETKTPPAAERNLLTAQGRPGTETNTPPAAERNLLTAQGRPGTETNTPPPAAERNLLTAQGRPGTETNTPPAAERNLLTAQGRPGTETNTPPAAERNLLTAQGRPGTETNTPPAAERNLLTAQGRPGTETNTPPAAERGI